MTTIAALQSEVDAARADLLDALDGITQDQLTADPEQASSPDDERWLVRDVLWHVGSYEDHTRRWIDAARRGVDAGAYAPRIRPPYLNTPELMFAWLDQTRRPTLALIAKLSQAELDEQRIGASGRETSFGRALAHLAQHDLEHAAQVRALRARASGAE